MVMILRKQYHKYDRPAWWWNIRVKEFPLVLREMYNYFAWFDNRACIQWNCRLAKRFGVSRRTICRRLERLKKLRLLWITSAGGKHRRIHCHHYKNMQEWIIAYSIPKVNYGPHKTTYKLTQNERQKRVNQQTKALLTKL